jgi:copper chaperone NosL
MSMSMMRIRSRLWTIAVLSSLLLAAAGCGGDAVAGQPRDIAVGVDACGYCHMSVDDVERAAQWVPASGPAITFDEPGCLVAWLQRNPGATGRAYVADGAGGGWVAAEEGAYLVGRVRTGMGFDVVAYAAGADAVERLGEEGGEAGEVLSWAELLERGVVDAHAR